MSVFKGLIIFIVAIGILALLGVIVLYGYHRIKLNSETLQAQGEMVKVNDHYMHAFVSGEGEHTFVFLSGHGTPSPVVDFKPLWEPLSQQAKIIVIERPGYGFSQPVNTARNVESILEETRTVLNELNIEGPYVLISHSMAGLEAMLWATLYPEEVEAIIGLEAITPSYVLNTLELPSKVSLRAMAFISRIGLSRFMSDEDRVQMMPILKHPMLDEQDQAVFLYNFYKQSYSKPVMNEIEFLKQNAKTVQENLNNFDMPILMISESSNHEYIESINEFNKKYPFSEQMVFDGTHYIHHDNGGQIIDAIWSLLDN